MIRHVAAALLMMGSMTTAGAETVRLLAAGSLKAAMTEAANTFEVRNPGAAVELEFAASGLLRERIEKGEAAHVFASADIGSSHRSSPSGHGQRQARRLRPQPTVRAGATPASPSPRRLTRCHARSEDPSGHLDAEGRSFGRLCVCAFCQGRGTQGQARAAALEAKALQLTGGPTSAKAPGGQATSMRG